MAEEKQQTEGARIAAIARAECNEATDERRQDLLATAMQLIYNSPTGAAQTVANRG